MNKKEAPGLLLNAYFDWLEQKRLEKTEEEKDLEGRMRRLRELAEELEEIKQRFFEELEKEKDRDALISIASGMGGMRRFWNKERRKAFLKALREPKDGEKTDIRLIYSQIHSRYLSLEKEGRFSKELFMHNLLRSYVDFRDAPGAGEIIRLSEERLPPFNNTLLALHNNHPSAAAAFMWAVKTTVEQCGAGKTLKKPIRTEFLERDKEAVSFIQRSIEKGAYPWGRFYTLLSGMKVNPEEQDVARPVLRWLHGPEGERLGKDILILLGFKLSITDALMYSAIRAVPGWDEKLAGAKFPGEGEIRRIVAKARKDGEFREEIFYESIPDSRIRIRDADAAEELLFLLQSRREGLADYLLFLGRIYPKLADTIPAMAVKAFLEEYPKKKQRA